MDSAANTESNSKNGDNMEMEKQLKERAEKNRQRALLLKKSKIITHPYVRCVSNTYVHKKIVNISAYETIIFFNDQILRS